MEPSHPPRQVLVVDDEPVIRHLTQIVLETAGYQALPAANGDEALVLYRHKQHDIDLVLLDLAMPGMSGQEVLHELRRLNSAVRVVICSAFITDNKNPWLHLGVRGVIGKPFRVDQLLQIIEQALSCEER